MNQPEWENEKTWFYSYFTVFDEQRMRWLTSQNGRTGEFQEICKNKTLCIRGNMDEAQEKRGAV